MLRAVSCPETLHELLVRGLRRGCRRREGARVHRILGIVIVVPVAVAVLPLVPDGSRGLFNHLELRTAIGARPTAVRLEGAHGAHGAGAHAGPDLLLPSLRLVRPAVQPAVQALLQAVQRLRRGAVDALPKAQRAFQGLQGGLDATKMKLSELGLQAGSCSTTFASFNICSATESASEIGSTPFKITLILFTLDGVHPTSSFRALLLGSIDLERLARRLLGPANMKCKLF